jgi:hypothetical protein
MNTQKLCAIGTAVTVTMSTPVVAGAAQTPDRPTHMTVCGVRKAPYVAANQAVLRTIPVYPRARWVNSYSIGIPARCLPVENRPPYDHYYSYRAYRLPRGTACGQVGRYYRRTLAARGWRWLGGYPWDASYVRGHALVHVSCGNGPRGGLILSADHRER